MQRRNPLRSAPIADEQATSRAIVVAPCFLEQVAAVHFPPGEIHRRLRRQRKGCLRESLARASAQADAFDSVGTGEGKVIHGIPNSLVELAERIAREAP